MVIIRKIIQECFVYMLVFLFGITLPWSLIFYPSSSKCVRDEKWLRNV